MFRISNQIEVSLIKAILLDTIFQICMKGKLPRGDSLFSTKVDLRATHTMKLFLDLLLYSSSFCGLQNLQGLDSLFDLSKILTPQLFLLQQQEQ